MPQRADEALSLQAEAVNAAKDADHTEPPSLAAGSLLMQGYMQMQAQRYAAAEQSFRTDLAQHPASGWALQGMVAALVKQGKQAEADKLKPDLERSWPLADGQLRTLP